MWNKALGGHPNALVPVWRHCRVCELIAYAKSAGPPDPNTPGWRLTLETRPHHH